MFKGVKLLGICTNKIIFFIVRTIRADFKYNQNVIRENFILEKNAV